MNSIAKLKGYVNNTDNIDELLSTAGVRTRYNRRKDPYSESVDRQERCFKRRGGRTTMQISKKSSRQRYYRHSVDAYEGGQKKWRMAAMITLGVSIREPGVYEGQDEWSIVVRTSGTWRVIRWIEWGCMSPAAVYGHQFILL